MHYIKLVKILYLIDREALNRWGVPVTTDSYASMKNGPVVRNILDLITKKDLPKPTWASYISEPLGDSEVELRADVNPPTDQLSRAEEKLIQEVYKQYGHKNRWDIIDNYMHKLPEWHDPKGSSFPIRIRQILEALGQNQEEINATLRELRSMRTAEEILSLAP
ncbi:MAG TPA: Panacea domain-containing protein [Terriglobales bacterium]|nr:Panacea domain-containing protein [Terriglobales bacterium]